MMTRRDPWVNMLRTTIAAFSAGLGGADAVAVLPFTAALGLPDRFARRNARYTQLVLLEEANLAKVADPAAGAGGIEDLTSRLAQAAWTLFQEIERAGGAPAALAKGLIQAQVAKVRAEREAALAHRRDALTGTSDFPNLAEAPVEVLDVEPVEPGTYPAAVRYPPLPRLRLAESFEALRDASDRILSATGARPTVFLANLGALSEFTARATFAKNFFETGGIEAITGDGFENREQMVAAFKASGAKLACLCSSDKVYDGEAAGVATALCAAGAYVLLAGRPKQMDALKSAGVSDFIYAGCDAIAALKTAHSVIASGR
jgi:methylmalonyl-CoA mutase